MRASTPTKLSLARWFGLMGVNRLHAAGVQLQGTTGSPNLQTSSCSQPWVQYDWQAPDVVSREEVARAIRQAEDNIEGIVGYRLLPSWEVDERIIIERPFRPEAIRFGNATPRGARTTAITRWGHLIAGGRRASATLGLALNIAYTDPDADGYDELATVTATATGLTDVCEIRTYYPGHVADDAYEIRPTTVVLAAGIATITFRRELAVLESVQEALIWETPDGADDANFLATVDVARVYNDPQAPATALWDPNGSCDCGQTTCAECAYSTQSLCLTPVNPRLGAFTYTPGTWDGTGFDTGSWSLGRAPDQLRVWYQAGFRDTRVACPSRDLAREWELVVARYAAALLDRPTCECAARGVERWMVDLAYASGAEELSVHRLTEDELGNPLGTRRGALQAWKACEQRAISRRAILV